MPPKPKTLEDVLPGDGGPEKQLRDHIINAVAGLLEDDAKSYQQQTLASHPIRKEEFEKLLPAASAYPPDWDEAAQQAFEKEWEEGPLKEAVSKAKTLQELARVWKLVPKVFGCLPTELIGPRRRLVWDRTLGGEGAVGKGSEVQPNIVWSNAFCQYLIICKTGGRRKWNLGPTNPTDSKFLDALQQAMQATGADESVRELHQRVLREDPGLTFSPISKLFLEIENRFYKAKRASLNDGAMFLVSEQDLRDLEKVVTAVWDRPFSTGTIQAHLF